MRMRILVDSEAKPKQMGERRRWEIDAEQALSNAMWILPHGIMPTHKHRRRLVPAVLKALVLDVVVSNTSCLSTMV